jgi:Beta/Gamma crystallin
MRRVTKTWFYREIITKLEWSLSDILASNNAGDNAREPRATIATHQERVSGWRDNRQPCTPQEAKMAHVILFEHAQFHGQHKHVFGPEPNLNAADDNYFNDKVSSLVVLEGNWAFFPDSGFKPAPYPAILGPGSYRGLPAGIKNDDMSSLQPVDALPTVFGEPVHSHVILFEHANFHGAHKHVFVQEPNLNAQDDSYFNDKVSSLSVLAGDWIFAADSDLMHRYPPILGPAFDAAGSLAPAGFPFVEFVGIKNDDMSSLAPVSMFPTVRSPRVEQVLLFEHANFHGAHKHVLVAEPNLNAPDDNFFNDKVSSFVILEGEWIFCSDWQFENPYANGRQFGIGTYPFVGDVGIKNDDMSSLFPTTLAFVSRWFSEGGILSNR